MTHKEVGARRSYGNTPPVWGCLVAEMFGCRFDLRILMIGGMSNNIEATFSHAWAGLNAIDSVIVVRGKKGIPHKKVRYLRLPELIYRLKPLKSVFQFTIALLLSWLRHPSLICAVHMAPQGYYGYLISKLTGIPLGLHLVSESQGGLNKREHYGSSGVVSLFGGLAHRAVKHACFITTTGNRSKSRLLKKGIPDSKVFVAPSVVDTSRFHPLQKPKDYDLITLARLSDEKRLDIFLRAIHEIMKIRSIKAAIAGTGPEEAKLKEMAKRLGLGDSLRFLGWISNTELNALYNSASVFVLTSATEGFPTTVAECLCAGTCCVAADVGDIGTIIEHGVNGFLISPFDEIEKYVRHVIKLLNNLEYAEQIASAGLEARETLSFANRVNIYRDMLTKTSCQSS